MRWIYNETTLRSLPPPYVTYARLNRIAFKLRGQRLYGRYLYRYLDNMRDTLPQQVRRRRYPDVSLVDFPDKKLFVNLRDRRAMMVLEEAQGANVETRVLRESLRPGDTFLDIGANHGTYSMVAAGLVGQTGRVLAFEPQPDLAALIRRSAEANGFRQIEVREAALSDKEDTGTFFVPETFSGTAGLHREFSAKENHRSFPVVLERLDDVLSSESLRGQVFIKMDVEGHELHVLRGAEQVICRYRPALLFELNRTALQAVGKSEGELLEVLHRYGYNECSLLHDFPTRIPLAAVESQTGDCFNVIAYSSLRSY